MHIHTYKSSSLVSGDDDKKQKIALYLLCHLLAKKGSDETMVYIFEKCKVNILVDKIVLTQCNGFAKALMLCFFSHYVLNLEYGKQIKEVALFFQEFVCNLPATSDKKLKNATYLSVTTDIQKYSMGSS